VTTSLAWFGWKLYDQQLAVVQQHLKARLENGADALDGDIRATVAEAGEQLSAWLASPGSQLPGINGGVVFASTRTGVRVSPPGSLPFVPLPRRSARGDERFRAAEALEFQAGDLSAAAAAYRTFVVHENKDIAAGALLRLGRVLRRSHDVSGALHAYRQLEGLGQIDVEGYPAELAALDGRRRTLAESGQPDEAQLLADRIAIGIDQGRWLIPRGTALEFRDNQSAITKPESWRLAEALTHLWAQRENGPTERGLRLVAGDARPVLLLWRAAGHEVVALVAFADRFLPPPGVRGIAFEITDADGARVAGASLPPPPSPVTRLTGDARSPWTLRVWADPTLEVEGSVMSASTMALAVALIVALFLWTTVYFTARAMRREARVARLQSDFVSAVSHEFRSPLTTMRQLSELLEMDEVPNAERRRTYYEVLAKESRRLQRLVETLLNFGRMEAGAERYRREPVSVPELVRQVARDLEALYRLSGLRIDAIGPNEGVIVLGDTDALALTIRNLLDNAVKYSPGAEAVRVEWAQDGPHVSIRVVDHGLGIDPSERDAIFGKFVRGRAAAVANVNGTGVGLAMARHVLMAHGGQISVQSEVGRGSTFTVLLPAAT
jgi:signal transduction histidine kinase